MSAGGEVLVIDAARLDGKNAARPVDHADVAEGQVDEAEFRQREIRLVAFLLQIAISSSW